MKEKIFFCNLDVKDGKKIKHFKNVVISENDIYYKKFEILKIDLIKEVGFKNNIK